MTVGLTIAQRKAAGKISVAVAADNYVFSRATDGKEFVGAHQDIINMVVAATQTLAVTQKAASYTAKQVDIYTLIEFTAAAVLTLPTDAQEPLIGVQAVFDFIQIGAGAVTWPAGITPGVPSIVGGVTYDIPLNFTIQRFVTNSWRKRAANEWILS